MKREALIHEESTSNSYLFLANTTHQNMFCFICSRTNQVVSFKKTRPPYLCAGCNNQFDKWYEKLYKTIFLLGVSCFQLLEVNSLNSTLNKELWKFLRSKEGCHQGRNSYQAHAHRIDFIDLIFLNFVDFLQFPT